MGPFWLKRHWLRPHFKRRPLSKTLMSLFDMQSMEWTPAACLLAFIAGMLTLSTSMLMFSCLRSCFYKMEPHTQKVFKNSQTYEISHCGHVLLWSLAMVAGLVAGAQVTCIFLLPSMVVWVCFHYSAGGKPHAVLNFALTVAVAYFGFVPFPMVPPLEWTPAAIWMTIIAILTVLAPLQFLLLSLAEYEKKPYLKKQFFDDPEGLSDGLVSDVGSGEKAKSYRRARELAWGAHLLGGGCCMAAAIISGGAQDLCLLAALPCATNGYCHWVRREEHAEQKFGGPSCWIIAAGLLYFGIAR